MSHWITGTEPKSNIVKNELALWYDSRAQKQLVAMGQPANVWKDLSGNKNDGHLINFGEGSGWTHDGLKFDGVDDYVQLPELGLNPDSFTVQKNNQIVVYDGDVQKTIDNGEIKTVGRNLIQNSGHEYGVGGTNEFIQLVDLAPIFETYGVDKKYSLSMDIKSQDISQHSIITVYMQNGSATKYFFVNKHITVTTEYQRFKFEGLTPTLSNSNETKAMLALYGVYNTENCPVARNIKLEIGSTATPYSLAPEDVLTNIDKLDEKILYNYRGKNLFKNSNYADKQAGEIIGLTSWGGNVQTAAYDNDVPAGLSGKSEKRICTVAGTGGSYHDTDTIELVTGETYTLSFWAKGSEKILHDSGYFMCLNRISDNYYITGPSVVLDTTWQRYSRTFTVASNEAGVYKRRSIIYIVSTSWISHFKLEKGSVATPYSLAPEDIRTVQRYMLYNRALTDDEIIQNYNAINFEMTPKSFTQDDYYNFMDFNRHKGNTEYISTFVMPLLGIHPAYQAINNVNLASLPFASILNRLEANITEIGQALSVAYPHARLTLQNVRMAGTFAAGQPMIIPRRIPLVGDWKNCKSWTDDGIAPDYTDANRWENNMKLVHEWANKQPKILTMKPSGTFAAGQQTFLPRGMI